MKPYLMLLFFCGGLTACVNGSFMSQANSVVHQPRHNDRECTSSNVLTLSGDPCNVIAWQGYIATLFFLTESERQYYLSTLTLTEVDQLKKILLLSHPNEALEVRKENIEKLEQRLSDYDSPLDQLFVLSLTTNKAVVARDEQIDSLTESLNVTRKELSETQDALSQAQDNIDAITNIEQQLSTEGAGIYD